MDRLIKQYGSGQQLKKKSSEKRSESANANANAAGDSGQDSVDSGDWVSYSGYSY